MSETIISFTQRIGGVLTDVTSVILRDSTGTFGVRREDTDATVVAAGTPLVHLSTGRYAYTFTDPAENLRYNFWIEFEYLGNTTTFEVENFAGGTGGGVAPADIPDALPRSCISLARFAQLIGEDECSVRGISTGTNPTYGECNNPIWSEFQRNTILRYLATAQEMIEGVTKYPLCPTYFADEYHPLNCNARAALPIHSKWKRLLAIGARAETTILAAAVIDYSIEPALIGPIATTVTDPAEIRVFYPGSEREIEPQAVVISGGNVRIWIPRCRLLAPDSFETQEGGSPYEDLSLFLATADVRRVYTDASVNGEFVFAHRSNADAVCLGCGQITCGEATADACLYISNPLTGAIDALRGEYAGGDWTVAGMNFNRQCYLPRATGIRLNYLAGLSPITLAAEQAVLRLANALMPRGLCGCGPLVSMWERDNRIPDFIDDIRARNPFGQSDGALEAYRFASAIASRKVSIL